MADDYDKLVERLQGEYFLVRKGRLYHLVGGTVASLIAIFSIFIGSAIATLDSSAAKTVEREIEQTAVAASKRYQSIMQIERQIAEKLDSLERLEGVEVQVQSLAETVTAFRNDANTNSITLTRRLESIETQSHPQHQAIQTLRLQFRELQRTSDANQQAIALIYSPFVEPHPNYCVPQRFDRDPRVERTLQRLGEIHNPLLELYRETPRQLLPQLAPTPSAVEHAPVALSVSDRYGNQRELHVDDVAGSFYIPTLDQRGATRMMDYRLLEQLDGRLANAEARGSRSRGSVSVLLPVGHVLSNKSMVSRSPLLQRFPPTTPPLILERR